jgi:hypothetical protein
MPFPKPAKKPKPGVLIKKVDDLVSKIVIARDRRCVVCGSTQQLECSHWIGRAHKGVRWDLRNCSANCNRCNYEHSNRAFEHGLSGYTIWMYRHHGQPVLQELIDHQDDLTKASRIQEIYEELKILAKSMNLT